MGCTRSQTLIRGGSGLRLRFRLNVGGKSETKFDRGPAGTAKVAVEEGSSVGVGEAEIAAVHSSSMNLPGWDCAIELV